MLCRVVRVKNSERQSLKGCKQGGTVGKRSPLRVCRGAALFLLFYDCCCWVTDAVVQMIIRACMYE